MRLKLSTAFTLTVLSLLVLPAQGQAVPDAKTSGGLTLRVGAGFSDFRTSFGPGTVKGGTLWIDCALSNPPRFLSGLGIEAEARDLSLAPAATQPSSRVDEAQGGAIYSWQHLKSIRPYAKALVGYGNFDRRLDGVQGHDSRTITVLGGGLEYRVLGHIWARADYEYQIWPDFWKTSQPVGSLTPSGFSLGAVYDLRLGHAR
jgi:opacity protein-like surface antigen